MTAQQNTENRFGRWKLTAEQAAKINAAEPAAMAAFYLDNLGFIRGKACKYIHNHYISTSICFEPSRYSLQDLVQQVYADMPYIDFTDRCTIGLSLFRIFDRAETGGITSTTLKDTLGYFSLDAPIVNHHAKNNDNDTTYFDFIASTQITKSAEEEYLQSLVGEEIPYETLSGKTLDDWLKELLPSYHEYLVMRYYLFRNWTDYEISDFLHLSKWDTVEKIRNRAIKTLSQSYFIFLEKLKEIDSLYYYKFAALMPKQEEKKRNAMCAFSLYTPVMAAPQCYAFS